MKNAQGASCSLSVLLSVKKYKDKYFDRIYCHDYKYDQYSRFLISMAMNDSYKIELIESYNKDTIKYYYKDDKVYTEYYNK